MNKKYVMLTIGIMCFLLTVGICIQVKTISNTNTTGISKNATENKLRDEVLRWKERYDNAYKQLGETENILEEERKKATEDNEETTQMKDELNKINKLLGLTDVKGEGIILIVDDNKDADSNILDQNAAVVHEGDLIEIVNILKNGGAEAISINDQRVVSTTAITCDGSVVRINGEKVGAPFEIKAIGSQERIKGVLEMPYNYIYWMGADGIDITIRKVNSIEIPKYEGIIKREYLKDR